MKKVTCYISKQRMLGAIKPSTTVAALTVPPEGIQDGEKQDTGPR